MKNVWQKVRKPVILTLAAVIIIGVYYYCSRVEKDNNERNIVHHIDNDGYNNKVENLVWVTAKEHAKIHS